MKRAIIVITAAAVVTGLFFAVAPVETTASLVLFGVLFGALGGLGIEVYLRLRKALGTFTAVAAIATISALVSGAGAWLMPECPGTTLAVSCPARYVGVWTVLGGLSPVIIALLLLPLYAAVMAVLMIRDMRRGTRSFQPPAAFGHFMVLLGVTQAPAKSADAKNFVKSPTKPVTRPTAAQSHTGARATRKKR